jgi:hypothetical protein
VTRIVVARDYASLGSPIAVPQMPTAVRMRVDAYLERMRLAIQLRNVDGTMSMPELVNMVRQNVPEALTVTPFQVEVAIVETLGKDTPPPARAKQTADGRSEQTAAAILNLLSKLPKELRFHAGPGLVVLSLSGATVEAGPVTGKATLGGGEVTLKGGTVSVTGTASYQGDTFGLKTSVGGASFDASIHRDDTTKDWSTWSASVKIPIAGGESVEERPPVQDLAESVTKAQAAIGDVIAHLRAGGKPTDDFVRKRMGDVKPAIGKVSSAVEQRKGPRASVKLSAGSGDPKLGSYGTASLVIEF